MLESWWQSTHVPSFELVKRPDGKPVRLATLDAVVPELIAPPSA
jgi:hypothetical protein